MPNSIDVSIIIVSWNVSRLLENCLESILSTSQGLSLEIFVVDNASMDDTVQILNKKFPQVHLIVNEKNIGFARANNQALRRAKGRFVIFLNPDTILTERALKSLVDFMTNHREIGLVGPRICYANGEVQKSCARSLPSLSSMFLYYILHVHKFPLLGAIYEKKYVSPYDYNIIQEVEAISGAAMMLRLEVAKAVNGFGESFLHSGEDIDLCFRVRKTGWKIFYFCDAVVIHLSGQSSCQIPVRTFINASLSVQEYLYRCFGAKQATFYRLAVQAVQAPLVIVMGCAKFLLGFESSQEFSTRLKIAKAIWSWRPIE